MAINEEESKEFEIEFQTQMLVDGKIRVNAKTREEAEEIAQERIEDVSDETTGRDLRDFVGKVEGLERLESNVLFARNYFDVMNDKDNGEEKMEGKKIELISRAFYLVRGELMQFMETELTQSGSSPGTATLHFKDKAGKTINFTTKLGADLVKGPLSNSEAMWEAL